MFNAAFVKETIHQASGYGFSVSDASFDMGAIDIARSHSCVYLSDALRTLKVSASTSSSVRCRFPP